MNIQTLEYAGFNSAFRALRLSYGKEPRSYMFWTKTLVGAEWGINIDSKDMSLVRALIRRGDEHAKVLRGILVWVEITAPMDWWGQFETYEVGRTRLMSSSRMHTIFKGLKGEELKEARKKTPCTYPLTKIDCFSYQTLARIYHQRKGHRIEEWAEFLEWIETLPYANELIINPDSNEKDSRTKDNAPEQQ